MPELYLVRHAQASFATEDYDRLSETGHKQAAWLGEYFREKNIRFDQLISGDMQRHKQTLESMNAVTKNETIVNYEVSSGFNEYDFAALVEAYGSRYPEDELYQARSWQHGDKKRFFQLLQRVLKAWQEEKISDTPETWQEYQGRINEEMEKLMQSATSGRKVLIMSSGGPISVFVGLVLGVPAERMIDLNFQVRNSGFSHFFYTKNKINLHEFNAIPHLQYPQRAEHITYG